MLITDITPPAEYFMHAYRKDTKNDPEGLFALLKWVRFAGDSLKMLHGEGTP